MTSTFEYRCVQLRCLLFILLFWAASPFFTFAQPGDPKKDPDKPVPITGIGILFIAGGAYGAHWYLRNRKFR